MAKRGQKKRTSESEKPAGSQYKLCEIRCLRRLSTIARALGEERTWKELIPFSAKTTMTMMRIGSQMRESDLVDWFIPLVKAQFC
ncbi:hypothetical protein F0562_032760 [Nyssa sinensis]|uniref:Uncharacterized protein n=1 Tax=Nyssa sinensis TaxID=561372 RepID=A0A5J5ATL3_9ASTE|nr:hypothetical protein F0562_032760 [Nyssa sinensis]